MQETQDRDMESQRREKFLLDANAAFAKLRRDAIAWMQEQEERTAWDVTLGDGLEEN